MYASSSATRSALLTLAAILMGSVGTGTLALAETALRNSDRIAPAAVQRVAAEGTETAQPSVEQKPETAASEPGAAPSATGAEPEVNEIDVRELEKKPEPTEAPAASIPAPAPQAPSDPLGAAIFARLNTTAPLIARFPAKEREAMLAFYALGDFKPVWIKDGAFTPAARSVFARLRAAGEDGLDPNAYPIPALSATATDTEVAEAELKASAAAVLYARDARGGRINLANLSKLVTPTLDIPGSDVVLGRLAGAGDDAGNLLQSYNPHQPGYLALKSRLASLRGGTPRAANRTLQLPAGPVLSVGMTDPRVPQLRDFFGLQARSPGTLDHGPGEPDLYDASVAEAVTKFQTSRGLPANGKLTRATVVTLAIPSAPKVQSGQSDLIVNMERWRWLPPELGPNYVMVNVPEYRLRVFKDGSLRDEARVIVGKTESPTPLFSGAMEYAVVNPSWFVPPSILKTMLASGRTGGFEVIRRGNTISLRQPPGERNALGFIKFMFPNQHAVYLHDTPNRGLFSASKRAFSHGCVRVDDPFRFAGAVLPDWTSERLRKLIGKGERTIRLPEKLPVHLAYFTAYVDDGGTYRTLPDVYGYDNRMKAALGFAPSRDAVATLPPEPKRGASVLADPTSGRRAATPTRRAATADSAEPATAGERVPASRPVISRAPRNEGARPPARQAEQRVRRAPAEQAFGEPGLWTPPPPPTQAPPRSWW